MMPRPRIDQELGGRDAADRPGSLECRAGPHRAHKFIDESRTITANSGHRRKCRQALAPLTEARRAANSLSHGRDARPVSRLSARIPRAASHRTTAPCPTAFLCRADAVPSEAAEGRVKGCGWHGMQVVMVRI
jgi:hypothetical protein